MADLPPAPDPGNAGVGIYQLLIIAKEHTPVSFHKSFFMKRQLFVLALMGLSPSLIKAQNQDSLKAETLEEVTISSIRASADAPVAQITVNRKEIEKRYQGQDGAFLLERLSPSIVSYSEAGTGLSNYGQMRLRGIDQSRINITLNGVPLNDMLDQGVFFSNFTDFGNSIESVQIQRGVGTSSNGVASYAGSMNFESLSLTQSEPFAELQFTGGSFNTLRASAEVHTGLMENRTAFYARMSRVQSDGYRYHSGTESNSLFFSGGYFGEKHALKFTGFAGRSENGLAYQAVPISMIKQDPRTNLISENDVDDFGQWLFQLQHTWRLGTKSSLVSTLYYGGAGGDFPLGSRDSTGAFTQFNLPLYNDHFGYMSTFSQSSDYGKFDVGVHLYSFFRKNLQFVEPDRIRPYNEEDSRKDELSVFGKWQKAFGKFKAFADVQVRQVYIDLGADETYLGEAPNIPVRDYLFVNPKIGLNYDINTHWQVYASYGRSGREPRRADIVGYEVNPGNIEDARNPESVKAEYVNDIEAGLRWQTEKVALDFNAYYMIFENEIAPIGVLIDQYFYQVYLNQESSFRRGVELSARWNFYKNWSIDAQMAYLNAEISSYSPAEQDVVYENVSPILSPEFNGQLQLNYQPIEGLDLGVRARYLSEQYMGLTNDPSLTVPESFIMDLMASWNFAGEHTLSVQYNNIGDVLYYTYGVPDDNGEAAYFVQAPSHVYATLRLVF